MYHCSDVVCVSFCYVSLSVIICCHLRIIFFFFQAEDGIRDLVRSRGLGDVYKRQSQIWLQIPAIIPSDWIVA